MAGIDDAIKQLDDAVWKQEMVRQLEELKRQIPAMTGDELDDLIKRLLEVNRILDA